MAGSIGANAALYRRLLGARVRSDMSYRASFWIRLISSSLVSLGDLVAVWVLLTKVQTLGEWRLWEVVYLYGASSVPFRFADAFVGGPVERIEFYVRTGSFDRFLTRPVSVFLQVLTEDFAPRRVGQFVAAVPFLVVSLSHLPITWTAQRAVFLGFQLIGATLIFAAIFVIVCCLAFWSPNTGEVANAFTYGGSTAADYPLHVMPQWIRAIAYSLVPIAFTAYLPAFALFDAPNPAGIPLWLAYASPLASIPCLGFAALVWHFGVTHYKSTGS